MVLEGYGLTEREVGIVLYLARGLSSKEIAAELSLSPHTVRDHVKAIFRKCGVTGSATWRSLQQDRRRICFLRRADGSTLQAGVR